MAVKEKSRNLGIDILCCFGVMFLLGLSFFKAVGYPEIPIDSYMSALPIAARWFCLSGAMLLAACTGYIMSTRKLSLSYFKIFGRLIYIYLICGAAAVGIRVLLLHEEFTLMQLLQSLFDFTASETAKFAGMYFGLLLAAPFINAAFHDLKTRRARMGFLVVAALVSTLQPMLQFGGICLIPEWCKGLFPLAGYIGGAYIRRYSKRRDIFSLIIFLLALCVAQTVVVLATSLPMGIMYCPWLDSMASLPCLCIAMCLVGIFRSKRDGIGAGHRFFAGAAGGALAALLLGDPLLNALMAPLEESFPDLSMRLYAGFAVIPMLFIMCAAIGLILQTPFLLIRQAVRSRQDDDAYEEAEETVEEETAEEETAEEATESTESVTPEEPEISAVSEISESQEVPAEEPGEAEEYEEDDEEDDEEYEEFEEYEDEAPEEAIPEEIHPSQRTAPPIPEPQEVSVPAYQPEISVRPAEKPIPVQETYQPPQPKSYTLDDILSEQGIPVKRKTNSVDDLIAELTKK